MEPRGGLEVGKRSRPSARAQPRVGAPHQAERSAWLVPLSRRPPEPMAESDLAWSTALVPLPAPRADGPRRPPLTAGLAALSGRERRRPARCHGTCRGNSAEHDVAKLFLRRPSGIERLQQHRGGETARKPGSHLYFLRGVTPRAMDEARTHVVHRLEITKEGPPLIKTVSYVVRPEHSKAEPQLPFAPLRQQQRLKRDDVVDECICVVLLSCAQ